MRLRTVSFLFVLLVSFNSSVFGSGHSLHFFGTGNGDIDRVKIPVDDPATSTPGPPVDVGASNFTIELWLKGHPAENRAAPVVCGPNDTWINGNIVLDRDRLNQDRKYGLSVAGGHLVFGVAGNGNGSLTICGTVDVLDGLWHHLAIQRRHSDGSMWIYVDGLLDAQGYGPDGDISYPDDGVPGNFCGGPCTNSDPFLVIGSEKRDAASPHPSFNGWIDELRVSNSLRYFADFSRPRVPFVADKKTVALYHFDEGTGTIAFDSAKAAGGPSDGLVKVGGAHAAPKWSADTPFDFGALALDANVTLQSFVSGFAKPIEITFAHDGSGRLFVAEQGGLIKIVSDGAVLPTPFLDISALVQCCGEQGLLGLAFHPDYKANGRFFVYYTRPSTAGGENVIARYERSPSNPNVANTDSATIRILLAIPHPTNTNHNGGKLAFGPDGYLYVGVGDGGSGDDPPNNAQTLATRLGKILRLDVDSNPSTPPYYAIPSSNPFTGATCATTCPEIYAYGLRNPWKFSFDRGTGDLFIGDVGQGAWEEVDFQSADTAGGQNYGWRNFEGNHCNGGIPGNPCTTSGLTFPIIEYGHNAMGGISITGGYRYRGSALPALAAAYLYADFGSQRVWGALVDEGGAWNPVQLTTASALVSTLGEDEAGEFYVAGYSGSGTTSIYKIVARDSDGDGLPDWWERAYFGDTIAASAAADTDGDGYTNLQEFRGGTDPLNAAAESGTLKTDFNGDGNSDIAWDNGAGSRWVYSMNGTSIQGFSPVPAAAAGWVLVGSGDFNGDGKADLLWQNSANRSQYWIYLMNGNAVIGGGGLTAAPGYVPRFIADFNGDGKADILWENASGERSIFHLNGATMLGGVGVPTAAPGWVLVGVGDFDNDGMADILWQNGANTTQYWIYLMIAGTIHGGGGFFVAPGYALTHSGDFDGDGSTDLLWENGAGGRWIFFMNGATIRSGMPVPSAAPGWNIAGIGDFNGDGKSDLLWQNSASPTQYWIYLLDGATVFQNGALTAASGYLPALPGY